MADQPKDDKAMSKSRYELVKQILNDAQGATNPSYQGHGKFWELALAEFLQVTVYGVRMIADAGEENFCEDVMAGSAASGCCESAAGSAGPSTEQPASDKSAAPTS